MPSAMDQRPDDFILTISDGEPEDQNSDQASDIESKVDLQPQSSNKRKRAGAADKSNKRRQYDHEHVEDSTRLSEDGFDPDFEFDLGMDVANDLEDFDGWGDVDLETRGKDKKTVNIDDIIARRIAKKGHLKDLNALATEETGLSSEEEGDGRRTGGEDEDVRKNDTDTLELGHDEMLADDVFGGQAGIERISFMDEGGHTGESASSDEDEDDDDSVATPTGHPNDSASQSDDETSSQTSHSSTNSAEAAKRAAFFTAEEQPRSNMFKDDSAATTFMRLNLSRPLLRALTTLKYAQPTPIQARAIPVALQGLDIVGSAKTGSGKTAAFLLPILERLLYRPSKIPVTRVAILMPTRELAVQCYNVATALARYTDVTVAQVVGGFSLREQENILRKRPDIVIATPGRFIDHMRNSASFQVESLEILVLDEADRMLEDGFADELDEILKTIPRGRQTMLFSATMTESVDKLIRVGMDKPVRINVDAKKSTVEGLVQEFVRLRPGREGHRLATLCLLCKNVFTKRTIIFFRQKKEAHRVRIVFGLLGIKSGELHGSMSQEQRITAVNAFRDGETTHLLATDLASRGLDIKNVMSVVNYEAPQSHEIYLHRVGRTARAGRSGRSCTIAAESDRKVVKAAVKAARLQGAKVASRTMDTKEVDVMHERIESFAGEIEEILVEEREEKALAQTETQIKRGENLVKHEAEIMSRPKRTWFESEKEKQKAKDKGRAELNFVGEKKKLSNKQKKRLDDTRDRIEGRTFKKSKDSESKVKAMRLDQKRNKRDKSKAKSKKSKK